MAIKKRRNPLLDDLKLLAFAIPVISVVGAFASKSISIAMDLVHKPELIAVQTDGNRYTDEKSELAKKDAFDHSDANRRTVELEMAELKTDVTRETAGIKAQEDVILQNVQDLRHEIENDRRPIRSR